MAQICGGDELQFLDVTTSPQAIKIRPVKVPRSLQTSGGYDCEFVEKPPSVIETECSICLHTLRIPKLIDCCGHNFCSTCIDKIAHDDNCCPLCNEEVYTLVRNKGLERSLNELDVKCSYFREGCAWTGKLGQFTSHISGGESSAVCGFVEVECQHDCRDYFERRSLKQHEEDECPYRPFSCDHCHDYNSTFEDVVSNHYPVCDSYPLPCPNKCDLPYAIERQDLASHVDNDCPLTVVDCDFHYAGCAVRLPRKDMPNHLRENITHISLMAAKLMEKDKQIAALTSELIRKQDDLETENNALKREISTLRKDFGVKVEVNCEAIASLSSHSGLPPCKIIMPDFSDLKDDEHVWNSHPFYTHSRGYKMCIKVYANGAGDLADTHVSVFVYLIQGEFDDELKWPFRGDITIQLLNQTGVGGHRERTTHFTNEASDKNAGRKAGGEKGRSKGFNRFIAHTELRPRYLRNDQLQFCISEVLCRSI